MAKQLMFNFSSKAGEIIGEHIHGHMLFQLRSQMLIHVPTHIYQSDDTLFKEAGMAFFCTHLPNYWAMKKPQNK